MTFIDDDFLLGTKFARELYHGYAAGLPVIDYHCHLSPGEIASDRRFGTITEAWLSGDHYKWRAMRTCGVDEKFITGNASDREKFDQWAATVPLTLRNPLYHWTHLELRRIFGVREKLLDSSTAKEIWEECNRLLASPGYSVRGILGKMNVEILCTVDDPVDTLEHHARMAGDPSMSVQVLPTFRPDRALAVDRPESFVTFCRELSAASGIAIGSYEEFIAALRSRHDYFHEHGCRLSDHGLETVYAGEFSPAGLESAFRRLLGGERLDGAAALELRSALLQGLAVMDWEKGWVQQFHIGALRNANSRMMRTLGPDTGFDSIGDAEVARPLARFLDSLDRENRLARTVLFNLNPRDNEVFATMAGNFQDGSVPGKIQLGPAWWFLDQANGMTRQMQALSDMGILSRFIGMVTDSRSFLSYPRHEYFRRLLCALLGEDMAGGLIPADMELVGSMVRDICYNNAKRYFRFPDRKKS
ncbi:MAG TPA: glucuronate isomerase [Bacteroidota bacterium]|nr:glucuronate isomerase [Bacteroidota bacterium]